MSSRQTAQLYWRHTLAYPGRFALVFLNMIQTGTNTILTPLMVGFAIQKLSSPETVGLSFSAIFSIILIGCLIGIACNRIAMYALSSLEVRVFADISNRVAQHLLSETYDFHAKSFSGALLNQSSRIAYGYVTFMDAIMSDSLRAFTVVFVSCFTLAFYNLPLAGIMLLMVSIGMSSTLLLANKRYPLRKAAVAAGTHQTAYLADMITNASTIKAFAAEPIELNHFHDITRGFGKKTLKSWHLQITAGNITTATALSMNLAVLTYGIYATQHGLLSIGVFVAAQLYAVRITNSFWDLSGIVRTLETVFGDAHEMTQILLDKPSLLDPVDAKELVITKGAVRLENVTFSYDSAQKNREVLKNFTLDIAPGEKVGLVGRSGGGKTTITKLLLRFMDIQSGSLSIDEQDISTVTQESLRKHIAYVPQEPLLFHRSIAENIGYGRPSASKKEIKEAAKLAFADGFIEQLPHGYETEVGERGVKLSGGQRQRIAIARAILKDAPILVLDEATSALDSDSERLIQSALSEIMKSRTSFVVAHRLSTIQKMDRIIVVDNGQILEQGSHEQLLAAKGVYAELWAHQSGGFLEE